MHLDTGLFVIGQYPGICKMPYANKSNWKTSGWENTVSCEVGPVGILFLKLLWFF